MASEVAEFYADRSVLVTGFTGFIGKVLVEKLLRSVPRIKEIYVLIRPMKGVPAQERLKKVLDSDLFDLLRESKGEEKESLFSKVIAINGDITEAGLGLSADDAKMICDRVSIVFHCAATVKFDEHMRLAVKMNVDGTKQLLSLCHKMKHLDAFVHTSTAYCNCDRTYIVERVYPSPIPWEKLIDSVKWMDDGMLDRLTPLLIGSRPNSYTFTKAVAESMLVEDPEANRLPIVIVRPSIVTATWKEPKAGWVDNCNGATGVLALAAKGLINIVYGRLQEVRSDLVPVDVVVNMLIVAGWHKGQGAGRPMPVIHCTTGRLNPVTWGDVTGTVLENFSKKMPLLDLHCLPGGKWTTWRFEYEARLYLLHLLPAYLVDWASALFGRRGRMVKLYQKIFKLLETLEYFYTNQWDFQSKMAVLLNKQLSDVDKKLFYIDVTPLEWPKYFDDYHWGVRKHIFKEDPSNLKLAKRAHFRRRLLMSGIDVALLAFLLRLIMKRTNCIQYISSLVSVLLMRIQTVKNVIV